MAKIAIKNPGRALDIAANVAKSSCLQKPGKSNVNTT